MLHVTLLAMRQGPAAARSECEMLIYLAARAEPENGHQEEQKTSTVKVGITVLSRCPTTSVKPLEPPYTRIFRAGRGRRREKQRGC